SVTPNHPGLNDLLVRSVDRAGNVGPIADYRFYVASGVDPVAVYSMAGSGGTLADTGSPGGHPATVSGNAVQGGGVTSFNGNGTVIQLYDCTGAWNQVWVPTADGALRNPQSGRCLDDSAWGTTNGTYLQLFDCTAAWNQVWQPQPNGSYVSAQAGRCVDVFNG